MFQVDVLVALPEPLPALRELCLTHVRFTGHQIEGLDFKKV